MSLEFHHDAKGSEFERQASAASPGTFAQLVYFLKHNKKWWLLPIVAILLLVALLVILSGTALAPFIYPLF